MSVPDRGILNSISLTTVNSSISQGIEMGGANSGNILKPARPEVLWLESGDNQIWEEVFEKLHVSGSNQTLCWRLKETSSNSVPSGWFDKKLRSKIVKPPVEPSRREKNHKSQRPETRAEKKHLFPTPLRLTHRKNLILL